jgi:hypothetical protein
MVEVAVAIMTVATDKIVVMIVDMIVAMTGDVITRGEIRSIAGKLFRQRG